MNYSTELPRQYKTWIAFYEATKHLIAKAEQERITDIVVQENAPELNAFIHNENLPIKEVELERKYAFTQIKNNAFEELLSERMTKGEVIRFINELENSFNYSGKSDWIAEKIQQVKRILLTQCTK